MFIPLIIWRQTQEPATGWPATRHYQARQVSVARSAANIRRQNPVAAQPDWLSGSKAQLARKKQAVSSGKIGDAGTRAWKNRKKGFRIRAGGQTRKGTTRHRAASRFFGRYKTFTTTNGRAWGFKRFTHWKTPSIFSVVRNVLIVIVGLCFGFIATPEPNRHKPAVDI